MRKLAASIAAGGAVFAIAATASADLGEQGSMALSADRLFGITSYSVTGEPDIDGAEEAEITGTNMSLLWGVSPSVGFEGITIPVPGTIPRLSFDFFVAESLSLGGSLGYYSFSGEVDPGGDADKYDLDKVTALALAPRVGYVIPLADAVYLWLRGGLTYMSVTVDPDEGDDVDGNVMQANLEGAFVFGIGENFGFHVGPAADLPLGGKITIPNGNPVDGGDLDVDIKVTSFGAYGGLVGWF